MAKEIDISRPGGKLTLMDMHEIATAAREWRWRRGLSQAQAADLLGISRSTYLGLEAGSASLKTVATWAKQAGYVVEIRKGRDRQ